MTEIDAALAEHLAGEATSLCHCWRLTRADGAALGFTDHDRPLACDGIQFQPETGLTASEARSSLGLAVDTMDVEGALSSARISEDDITAGLYDGAEIATYVVNWREPEQFLKLSVAVIGKITRRDGAFIAELESRAVKLDQPNGRTVRRDCDAELGDERCGFVPIGPQYIATGTLVAALAGDVLIVDGLGDFASGWFANGLLTWTTGALAGRKERVVGHTAADGQASLSLWREATLAVAPGAAFDIVAGCDKRFSTCQAKFANSANFRGFPHLPGNDAGYGYVTQDGVFDGGPLVP